MGRVNRLRCSDSRSAMVDLYKYTFLDCKEMLRRVHIVCMLVLNHDAALCWITDPQLCV